MKTLIKTFTAILFIAITATAQTVWNGTADTTWYTNNKTLSSYTITSAEQLAGLARLVNGVSGANGNGTYNMSGKTIKLGNDIMLNDTTNWKNWGTSNTDLKRWITIGTSSSNSFKGSFDGAGYVINGVYINNTTDNQGLFRYLGEGGTIKNVGVVASYIKGNNNVGGLVGASEGTVSNSYSTGTVSGGCNGGSVAGRVGGLVGLNNSTVSNSYFTGTVTGKDCYYVGGLVGSNGGTVSNSYSTGAVSGEYYVGGLVGDNNNYGVVNNSYSTAVVSGTGGGIGGLVGYNDHYGTVSNSYYDKETCGQSDEDNKGIGKTTAEMKTQNTYIDWDFAGVWAINPTINNGYPYLKEEISTPILPQIAGGKIQAQVTGNNIVLQNLPNNSKVEVYNLKGSRIYSGNTGNISTLDIGVQTKGMYIVRATFGSKRQVMKIAVR